MISLQNWHIGSKTYIFSNAIKSFPPKCIFWLMFEQKPTGLYCLHVSVATGYIQIGWAIIAWFNPVFIFKSFIFPCNDYFMIK